MVYNTFLKSLQSQTDSQETIINQLKVVSYIVSPLDFTRVVVVNYCRVEHDGSHNSIEYIMFVSLFVSVSAQLTGHVMCMVYIVRTEVPVPKKMMKGMMGVNYESIYNWRQGFQGEPESTAGGVAVVWNE